MWDLGRGEGECVGGDEGGEMEGGRRGREDKEERLFPTPP